MNNTVSISILIVALSIAFAAIGMVAYLFDLDDLFRKIYRRIEAGTEKVKQEEYERGIKRGRKEFAIDIDRILDLYLCDLKTVYTHQVKEKLEKRIAEEVRK